MNLLDVVRRTAAAAPWAERDFTDLALCPSLTGAVDETQRDFFALVARKRSGHTA